VRTAIDVEALRRELGRRGMTQAELATVAGVSQATVSHAMVGRNIAWTTLRKLAKALTMTPTMPGADLLVPAKRDSSTSSPEGSASGPRRAQSA
jgi:transcriptional regulator with XRE-family HTH domain